MSLVNQIVSKVLLKGDQTVLSPVSLQLVLMMVAMATRGKTQKEILKVLDIDKRDLVREYKYLLGSLELSEGAIKYYNHVFYDKMLTLKQNLDDSILLQSFDSKSEADKEQINALITEETKGLIKDISISPDDIAIFLNVLYFKDKWWRGCNVKLDAIKPFTNVDGTVQNTQYIKGKITNYEQLDKGECFAVRYTSPNTLVVFLPKEDISLNEVFLRAEEEDEDIIEKILDSRSGFAPKDSTFSMPKVKVESDFQLSPILKEFIPDVFTDAADFSPLFDKHCKATTVQQKAVVDINEEGTEAAAITAFSMMLNSCCKYEKPVHIEVNRPFFYAIVNNEDDILFCGTVSNIW